MAAPLVAIRWAPIAGQWLTFWSVPGRPLVMHDHAVLALALGLRPKQCRRAGGQGLTARHVLNRRGEVRRAILAPPAAAARLFALARELGRAGVDDAEAAFAAAWWQATETANKEAA